MRFAFLSAFPPFRGGIAQFSTALVKELRKEHEVQAFTFTRQYPDLLFPGTSQYQPGPDESGMAAQRVLDSVGPWTWGRAATRMIETKPDVAVLRYWMPFFAPAMGMVARKLRRNGVPVLSIVDNAMPHEKYFYDKRFTRWFLQQNDALVALSEPVRDDILAICPGAQVHLLFHPLYDHFGAPEPRALARQALGLPADGRVLLFFGLIREYKGLDLLIEAFGKLGPGHHLVIAGEPYGDFGPYRKLIDRNPNKGNIHLHARFIGDDEVPRFFSAADAVVLPYRTATQSGITAVAYHFGVPVVATDVGGLGSTVEQGKTGILLPHGTADAVAEGIRQLFTLDQQTLRDNIAALRERLSWHRFAADFAAISRRLRRG